MTKVNAATQLTVLDGKVCCPDCKRNAIIHSYDISHRTTQFRVEDNQIIAIGHEEEESHTYRVLCENCGWQESDCGVDVD